MITEIWKDVPGFERIYQVSNLGNVKSLKRTFWRETIKRRAHWITLNEKLLNPQKDGVGYLHVRLAKNKRYTLWKVHQLVASTFLNYNRKDKETEVHHLNSVRTDNRLENLEVIGSLEHHRVHSKLYQEIKHIKPRKWRRRK